MKHEPVRPAKPYHHGDLRAVLLRVAEEILERDGVQALTLRAAARAAGVSPGAPAHHFGDLTGLLTDLAAAGYRQFTAALTGAMDRAERKPRLRMRAMGQAYVGFAREHPGLFTLMFRSEQLDSDRPSLRAAIDEARQILRAGVSAVSPPGQNLTPVAVAARGTALWCLVHGFAVLLLEGRLRATLNSLPNGNVDTLLDTVLALTEVGDSVPDEHELQKDL